MNDEVIDDILQRMQKVLTCKQLRVLKAELIAAFEPKK